VIDYASFMMKKATLLVTELARISLTSDDKYIGAGCILFNRWVSELQPKYRGIRANEDPRNHAIDSGRMGAPDCLATIAYGTIA
jgi:hypothetical protein